MQGWKESCRGEDGNGEVVHFFALLSSYLFSSLPCGFPSFLLVLLRGTGERLQGVEWNRCVMSCYFWPVASFLACCHYFYLHSFLQLSLFGPTLGRKMEGHTRRKQKLCLTVVCCFSQSVSVGKILAHSMKTTSSAQWVGL